MPFGAFRNLWGPLASVKIHWVLAFLLIVIIGLQLIVEKRVPRACFTRVSAVVVRKHQHGTHMSSIQTYIRFSSYDA